MSEIRARGETAPACAACGAEDIGANHEHKKRVYRVTGLHCAVCAEKIEAEIKKLPGVKAAGLDFAAARLSVTAGREEELPYAGKLTKLAGAIEPGVRFEEEKPTKQAEEHDEAIGRGEIFTLAAGLALFLAALLLPLPRWAEVALFAAAYLSAGGEVLLRAAGNLRRGRMLDENFLMGIATLGAFAVGELPEGVAVMLFYRVGELFESLAVRRSRRSIAALMDIRPDYANRKTGDGVERVSPEEVRVGEYILVKPGEKVPLDGIVETGRSLLDTAALTGESVPREAGAGDEVLSGSISQNGVLTIRVTKEYGESTVSKILELVQNAGSRKAKTEQFITKFARWYTPAVVGAAAALALLPPLVIPGAAFAEWVRRALLFLVVSCPCALVISVPLAFFGGIGAASRRGILIKGGNFLEALCDTDTVVFDKTGTLTKGVFRLTRTLPEEGFSEKELLFFAAGAERYSDHPIARSVRAAYPGKEDAGEDETYAELPGRGVRATVGGKTVLAGNGSLMREEHIPFREIGSAGTVLYVAVDGRYAGCLEISDEIKQDSKKAIAALRAIGVRKLVMLTGDSRAVGESVGSELGLDEVHSELLPHQKVEAEEALSNEMPRRGKLVFVGDGINDAPALARADVGIAMGGLGRDAAMEAADVVLMTDEPAKIAEGIALARRTRAIARQNIVFALAIKAVVLILGAAGLATMWAAVFADVGVAVLAVLNSLRVLHSR